MAATDVLPQDEELDRELDREADMADDEGPDAGLELEDEETPTESE